MRTVRAPSHFHGKRKRVWATGRTGSCSGATTQLFPPSVLTSTRTILPRPLHARPVIWVHALGVTRPGNVGAVRTDFASMTKLNWRDVPFASGSVYFDVSSRNIPGPSDTSMRRTHFTQ